MNCRLCQTCWNYWKRYGGLKVASRLADSDIETMKKRSGSDIEDDSLSVLGGGATIITGSSLANHRPHR